MLDGTGISAEDPGFIRMKKKGHRGTPFYREGFS
jgi:hypothetical protein